MKSSVRNVVLGAAHAFLLAAATLAEQVEQRGTPQEKEWLSCRDASECSWVIGEGGWPTAVSDRHRDSYLSWVASRAPFTTYFTPGDCFAMEEEFAAYLSQSRSSVVCAESHCSLDVEPKCTK